MLISNNSISQTDTKTLKSQLDAKKEDFSRKASEEKKRIYEEGLKSVEQTGILKSAKQIGDIAPDFTLNNSNGVEISLKEQLKNGPVILIWYRGGWCPYCNITLISLQKEINNFKQFGANLIALTPELPERSLTTKEKNKLGFEVLSDVSNLVAKDYGVVFKLTPEVAESYQKGFDLHSYNGDDSDELPLAATYVINQDGKIVYSFLDVDYRNRAEPSEILEVLKNLKTN